MEWLKKLLEDGKVAIGNLIAARNKELPKHNVLKETFNSINEQLKRVTKTVDDLPSNKDNEALQKTIETYEEAIKI